MTQQHGYIYIRTHPSYDIENACKVGKTKNIPERENTYATGEIKRGNFEAVFEVPFENMDEISASVIQDEITNTINNYEPRVNLIDVVVSPNYDENEFKFTHAYKLKAEIFNR